MSEPTEQGKDRVPGESRDSDLRGELISYSAGFVLAVLLTIASFLAVHSGIIYGPGIPVALIALAIAQMGVHLVFFLHVTSGPDNTNNALALAFGVLIIGLVLGGSIWIMQHLDARLMSPEMAM